MQTIFAIGDIHGQIDMLHRALETIAKDADAGAPVVFLGDYVDRGPDSRAVLDLLMQGQADGLPWTVLKGNHDRYMTRFLGDADYRDANTTKNYHWLDAPIGGRKTLASYGVDVDDRRSHADIQADAREAVPQSHVDYIEGLPLMHVTDDQIFVHAGIRPGVALDDQVEDDLIWIRKGWLEDERDHGRLVVHGHTALETPQHHGNRLNLDGGAGYGRPLLPARLVGRDAWVLNAFGRARL
ncbi:metallophosphoesterase family protein [Pseudoprimorskyibacter insulae]|uniref:Bis(5'-nucleosyl)-tetraphosphatase, symmetrical n=1 Tax=Pseudoprimorskyibacter insulae TaxID=1695997 RepID=A0A2R8AYW1_9RHOB|nr:metallophosphoesterase family protein [Pseudoprimorskyibacter insulae]SPF81157.1 Bis(5'-nucleosyl)-tetraphosphatase, symmetrical [Pseudoprimorskyibacter insulae]